MQYGYFDDEHREYVITRPDTPRSWINYLGSRLYGGIITQNAGGFSFLESGGTGRILRMRFNSLPLDQPGRYLYLRDDETGDYWSASWQPVGKNLQSQKCRVRHGLGYSIFESEYSGISSELTVFIPEGAAFEYWALKLRNAGQRQRKISVFSYAELANEWHFRQDMENLQYSQYIVKASFVEGMIHRVTNTNPGTNELFFGLRGADIVSFDTDRDIFLGPYRTQAKPLAVERGSCSGSLAVGDNACASLQTSVPIAPGEERSLVYILGVGNPHGEWRGYPSGKSVLDEYANPAKVEEELGKLEQEWAERLSGLQVRTPEKDLDSMVNVWHAYQTHIAFNWSRGISLIEAGGRDGIGYRDTAQDSLSVAHSVPVAVRERLELLLSGQTSQGCALPLIQPQSHRPGKEALPPIGRIRSDDALWLPLAVENYVYETGELSFLDIVLPYADSGESDVYGHLRRALEFALAHRGANGLVQGLAADWNDCIPWGSGESLFSSFLFHEGCRIISELAKLREERGEAEAWAREASEMAEAIERKGWDGEWYLRGITADGWGMGSAKNDEGKIYLESNVWAVISGAAQAERAARAMESVHAHLSSEHGLPLMWPAHTKSESHIVLPLVYPPGHKENGGIFCHSNSWAVIAEAMLGNGDRAYEYYRSYLPSRLNSHAEIRQAEPYVYAQFTHGPSSPRFGQSRNPWLTGTASWTYVALTRYILGIRPRMDGLLLDPCIPRAWKGFNAVRAFRGRKIDIRVKNPKGICRGLESVLLNGERIEGNLIPLELLKEKNEVIASLGG